MKKYYHVFNTSLWLINIALWIGVTAHDSQEKSLKWCAEHREQIYQSLQINRYMGPWAEVWVMHGEARVSGTSDTMLIMQSTKDGRMMLITRTHFDMTFMKLR